MKILLDIPSLLHVVLEPFTREEVAVLVSTRLSVTERRIPTELIDVLWSKSQGNPLFTEELLRSLQELGVIEVIDGNVTYKSNETVEVPDSVQAVITNRIDKLSNIQQMVIKVASVIGRKFPCNLLHHILPMKIPINELLEHVKDLERKEMFVVYEPVNKIYSFATAVTQVTYSEFSLK